MYILRSPCIGIIAGDARTSWIWCIRCLNCHDGLLFLWPHGNYLDFIFILPWETCSCSFVMVRKSLYSFFFTMISIGSLFFMVENGLFWGPDGTIPWASMDIIKKIPWNIRFGIVSWYFLYWLRFLYHEISNYNFLSWYKIKNCYDSR